MPVSGTANFIQLRPSATLQARNVTLALLGELAGVAQEIEHGLP